MVEQFNLGASLGKNFTIGSDVCGIGKVVDDEDVNQV